MWHKAVPSDTCRRIYVCTGKHAHICHSKLATSASAKHLIGFCYPSSLPLSVVGCRMHRSREHICCTFAAHAAVFAIAIMVAVVSGKVGLIQCGKWQQNRRRKSTQKIAKNEASKVLHSIWVCVYCVYCVCACVCGDNPLLWHIK